jgi:1-acyl-sn-glycerol-3-phosphate acyltransferase
VTAQRSAAAALWRLLRTFVHVVQGLWIIRTRFGRLGAAQRTEHIRDWSGQVLRILGVELVVHGEPWRSGPALVVANHVSWLDILVMNAVQPARFVSKADVKHWPLLGSLITGAGTLYIEREKRRDAMRVVHHVAERLQAKDLIAIFPEGTTGDGVTMLPFHANLFEAAIAAEAPVLPVALSFVHAPTGGRHDAPTYIGDTTLIASLWATLRATGLQAVVTYGDAQLCEGRTRRVWAQAVRAAIAELLPRD